MADALVMTVTAATSPSIDSALNALLRQGSRVASTSAATTSAASNADTDPAKATADSATTVDLSERAQALLQQAKDNQAAALDLPKSFDEMVQKRTDDFAARLAKDFAAEDIPLDEATTLSLDSSGKVRADGPYKERIEKYFKDNPDAAKEFKAVATLNALRATAEALRLYNEEKKAATSKDEETAAFDRFTARAINIQSLSGILTLKDGKLSSAAMDYVTALSTPADQVKAAQASAAPAQAVDIQA